jgi:hypothetical protein
MVCLPNDLRALSKLPSAENDKCALQLTQWTHLGQTTNLYPLNNTAKGKNEVLNYFKCLSNSNWHLELVRP